MIIKVIEIKNKSGLNIKLSGLLVKTVRNFDCEIKFKFKNKVVNAKSILGIMSASVRCGDVVEFMCSGSDEQEALEAVSEILASTSV